MSSRANKIDLSSLDPSREKARWEARIAATIEGVRMARAPRVSELLLAWARPALVTFAVLVAVVWVLPVTMQGEAAAATFDRTAQLGEWASNDALPATDSILEVIGDDEHGY